MDQSLVPLVGQNQSVQPGSHQSRRHMSLQKLSLVVDMELASMEEVVVVANMEPAVELANMVAVVVVASTELVLGKALGLE